MEDGRTPFQVYLHDRDMNNKEKAVDTELVAQGTEIICDAPEAMVCRSSGDTIPNCLGEFREIKERTGIVTFGHPAGTPEQTGVERLGHERTVNG